MLFINRKTLSIDSAICCNLEISLIGSIINQDFIAVSGRTGKTHQAVLCDKINPTVKDILQINHHRSMLKKAHI